MVCLCYGYGCADDEFYFSDEKYFLKCDIVNFVRVFYKYPDVQNNFKEHKTRHFGITEMGGGVVQMFHLFCARLYLRFQRDKTLGTNM